MRVIVTKDGLSFKGRSVDFFDGGDHVVCQKNKEFEKIYKVNISSDREGYNDDESQSLSVFLLLLFVGVFVFSLIGF